MTSRPSGLERLAPWLAGAVIALPVLLSRYPPMTDVPLHEAVVGLLRHWGDPKYVPPDVYDLNLGLGNQLFYFLILALSYAMPMAMATKAVVAATLVFLLVATGRLADHLGVTRWAAALVAPIGLGWMFFWGLLANMMGVGLYLFMLPAIDRFCERPTGRGLAAVSGFVVLLHFTHDLMTLVAGGTFVLLTVCAWRGWRENVVRVLPALLVLALALSTRAVAAKLLSHQHQRWAAVAWYGLDHKIATIPGVLYAGYEGWVRDLLFVLCLVPMVLFGIERWNHRARAAPPRTWRDRAHDRRFEILCALLVVSYFAAPANMKETTLIYQRFLTPAWILLTLTVCTRARLEHPWRLPRLLAGFVPLAPLLTSFPSFVESDRIYTELDAVIAHMEPGSTYLPIELELGPSSYQLYYPIIGGGHVVGVLGGRGFYDFSFSETAPVYQRKDRQWTTIVDRMTGHSYDMMPSYDLTHFRYVLFHSPDVNAANVAVLAVAPEARMIFRTGEWTLMESTLPLVPADYPDEPTPSPRPKTLRKRCIEVAERVRGESELPPAAP